MTAKNQKFSKNVHTSGVQKVDSQENLTSQNQNKKIKNRNNAKNKLNNNQIIYLISFFACIILFLLLLVDWGFKVVDPWYKAVQLVDSSRKVENLELKKNLLETGGQQLRELSAKHPYHARVHFLLGYYYMTATKWDSAIIHYKTAIHQDSGSTINSVWMYAQQHLAICIQNLNNQYISNGKPEAALALLDSVKYAMFSNPDYEFQYGILYHQLAKIDSAFIHYENAIRINPNYPNPDLFNNMGIILLNKQKFSEALDYFKKCLMLNPKHQNGLRNIAICYQQLGNATEAQKYLAILNGQ